ncbi:exocyst complex component Sec5-domain-containing protein [Lipomyces oligophaga]|uniref:exocyst complex component Sec5-domain-containing protein n=1 Tax=Lipomyces oligophaga TaxID=45792 RepID=UPI0034CD591E
MDSIPDDGLDPVFVAYGLSTPFPVSWEDKDPDEKKFVFVLGSDTGFDFNNGGTVDRNKDDERNRIMQRSFDAFIKMKSSVDIAYGEMTRDFLQERNNWGIGGIAQTIQEANQRSADIMEPLINNKTRSDTLKATLSLIDKHRYLFDLPAALQTSINKNDNDLLLRDYRRGRALTEEIRTLPHQSDLTEYNIQQRRVIERIWQEVESVVEDYKQDLWMRLVHTSPDDNYLLYINILLELGVDDNPIWVYLKAQFESLRQKISEAFYDLNTCVCVLQKDLKAVERPNLEALSAMLLHSIKLVNSKPRADVIRDTPEIVSTWIKLRAVVEEVVIYFGNQISLLWNCCEGFLTGSTQRTFPDTINPESRVHLSFSETEAKELRDDGNKLIERLASELSEFFLRTVPQSAELAASPSPKRPERADTFDVEDGDGIKLSGGSTQDTGNRITNLSNNSSVSISASAMLATSLKNDKPPEVPRLSPANQNLVSAEDSDKALILYAFLPEGSNALSASYYISLILGTVGTVASELAGLTISSSHIETLREMMSTVRERCVSAACLAWQQDAKRFHILEDWRPLSLRNNTMLPSIFFQYQIRLLESIGRVILVSDAERRSKVKVISPPSSQLLTNIQIQFTNSILLVLDGLMKDATNVDGQVAADSEAARVSTDTRVLMLICNIAELSNIVIPQLFDKFTDVFSIKLTDKTHIIDDSLQKLDSRLFYIFMKSKRGTISNIVRHGILKSGADWGQYPSPTSVSPFVYEVLLLFVRVHAQVSSVAEGLINRVVKELLLLAVQTMLDCYRQVNKFSLGGMLQATIDVQFIDQETSSLVTDEIMKLFEATYAAIQDVTDKSAMVPTEMAVQLDRMKKLLLQSHKNSRVEFLCFANERKNMSRSRSQSRGGQPRKQYSENNAVPLPTTPGNFL